MQEEIWKNTNYDYIEVSNFGNVRTKEIMRPFRFFDRHHKTFRVVERKIKSHIMKVQENNKGYFFVCMKEFGKRKNLLIHRLVAEAFIPNPENKPEVNHIDGNPHNNRVDNLEWVTSSENRKHAYWKLGRTCFFHRAKYFASLLFILLLGGCAKTAPETATDAALAQVGAVEQAIKKECPAAKIDEQMNALRATVQSQLATCESQISVERSEKRTWQVVAGGLLLVIVAYFLGKSRKVI